MTGLFETVYLQYVASKSHDGSHKEGVERTVRKCNREEERKLGGSVELGSHTETQKQRAVRLSYKFVKWEKEELLEFFQL